MPLDCLARKWTNQTFHSHTAPMYHWYVAASLNRAVESIPCSLTDMVPCTNDNTFLLYTFAVPMSFPRLRVAQEVMPAPATTSVRHTKHMHLYEQCAANWPTSDTLCMHIPFSFFVQLIELIEMLTCTISMCVSVLNPAALSCICGSVYCEPFSQGTIDCLSIQQYCLP